MTTTKLDTFTRQYLITALWAEMDGADDQGGEPLDANYTIDDFSPESLEKAITDCAKFQADNAAILEPLDKDDIERAGHDFWLTRNGHGAGFWDGDWPEHGDALTESSKSFRNVDIYVGDDGQLHMS